MNGRPLPRVFSLLSVEKDPGADDALCEALPHLGEEAREAALTLICERGRPSALAALLVGSASFDHSLQQAIFRRFDDFQPGLRAALASDHFEDRSAAISAVVAARDFRSVHSLADALGSHCSRTRELAANGIRALTEALIARRRRGTSPSDGVDIPLCTERLGQVLQYVVKSWESHQHAGVLEAALWMIESVEDALAEQLGRVPNRIGHAVEAILDRASEPRLAAFVVRALGYAQLRESAAKKIFKASDSVFVAALIDEMWLLADPQIEHEFQRVLETPGFAQWLPSNPSSNSAMTAGAVRMIACSGGARDNVVANLKAISDQGGEQARRAVLWNLVANESAPATQALSLIASRADDPCSIVAVRECERRRRRDRPSLKRTVAERPSHPVVLALDRFIEEHDRLSAPERSSLAGQFKTIGSDLVKQLERKLGNPGSNRAATLRAIRTLDLVSSLLPSIYRCAHDPDSLVRSTALVLLDQDKSPTAVRLLRDALNDVDPRVQAAAIEALEHLGIEKVSLQVRAKFESRNNRVRANAIKALWKTRIQDAAQALESMLKDKAPEHRISALWVVERVRLRSIMELLEAMSRTDPDRRIRARASRVLGAIGISKQLV